MAKSQQHGPSASRSEVLILDGCTLGVDDFVNHLAYPNGRVQLGRQSLAAVKLSRATFDRASRSSAPCYGINTGFGDLVDVSISPRHRESQQARLVLSHAVGVKDSLDVTLCRAIFLARLNCLARGASGVRPETLRLLIDLYNAGAYPEIFSAGSMGASGDLAPLAHLACFAMGEGWGYLRGARLPAAQILAHLKMTPLRLARKEGLSLINGTSAMTAISIIALDRLALAFEVSLASIAMLMSTLSISPAFMIGSAFDLKPHKGSRLVAKYIKMLCYEARKSELRPDRILQAVYSFRCVPFILGPFAETLSNAREVLRIELNSANDNPLALGNGEIYHGGHFHGHPVSVKMDQIRIAAVHISGVLDRQLEFMFDRRRNPDLPPFLAFDVRHGHCGLEGAQYLLSSLHAEARALAQPLSVHLVPTNAGNQDLVSMGMQSALATLEMADNTLKALAVHLLASLQASELQKLTLHARIRSFASALSRRVELPYRDNGMMCDLINALSDEANLSFALQELRRHNPRLPRVRV